MRSIQKKIRRTITLTYIIIKGKKNNTSLLIIFFCASVRSIQKKIRRTTKSKLSWYNPKVDLFSMLRA
uniref:Unclassified n=1 Tax=Fusarium pseudograminearum CS3487 TaxID=1318458 RepID=W1IBI5_FUSPS|nr:unclassified [Fusarium pseudograminearum CS3487]CDX48324.1 unclassified [Fusarium pseudograminearum CS3487]